MSYKPEFRVFDDPQWYRNGQTFATHKEASKSAESRLYRWLAAECYRIVEVPDAEFPVNYRWDEELGDVMLD
jgi:hypothetical protein